ncbi:BNR-4 repeat-containing protein [Acinetobacter puyangensis]|uniref:BNR-4 repeat-containing protein n=1 Tax=Acinetobacter puyangensis TaxID=1096779 RepID=UPI003A4D1FEA
MAELPSADQFNAPTVTEAQFKEAQAKLIGYVAEIGDKTVAIQYGFQSLEDFEADKTKIPAGSSVVVAGELYVWDGVTLIKSAYDPVVLTKDYVDSKADSADGFVTTQAFMLGRGLPTDVSDTVEVVNGLVYNADGSIESATATAWNAYFIPVKKGDIVEVSGYYGSNGYEPQGLLIQMTENKGFIETLYSLVSPGHVAQYSAKITATADGLIYMRHRFENGTLPHSITVTTQSNGYAIKQDINNILLNNESDITHKYQPAGYFVINPDLTITQSNNWLAFYIPVKKGDVIQLTGRLGNVNSTDPLKHLAQLDEDKNFVAWVGESEARTVYAGSVSATATQDGYMYVRVRYMTAVDDYKIENFPQNRQLTNEEIPRFATADEVRELRDAINSSDTIDILPECKIYPDRIMKIDGTIEVATTLGIVYAVYAPVKKGDVIQLTGRIGSGSAEAIAYLNQLDKDFNFVENIYSYVSTGSNLLTAGTAIGTATQDGYMYVRVDLRNPYSVSRVVNRNNTVVDTSASPVTTAILEKLPVRGDNRHGYNFAPFSQNTIITKDDKQYIVIVDENRNPVILQRDVGSYDWNTFNLGALEGNPFAAPNALDGHNNFSVIVTKDGYIIVTGNHHVHPCRATISSNPHDITAWRQIKYTLSTAVTYPRFVQFADDTVLAFWREGGSGNGAFYMCTFNDETLEFNSKILIIDATNSNPYEQFIGMGQDGSLHMCWGYRQQASSANTNYGMFYAKSHDKGVTWINAEETNSYALPLAESNSQKIFDAPMNSGYVNQNGGCCDLNSNYHTVIFQYDVNNKTQIVHLWFDGNTWKNEIVSDFTFYYDLSGALTTNEISRPLIGCGPSGKLFVVYHTSNMNRENDIRIIDVTTPMRPKDMCLAKFNTYLLELTFNTDYMLRDNELVMLLSKGTGGSSVSAYSNQPMYLMTAPLP